MKTPRTPRLLRGLTALAGGLILFTGTAPAAPFLYAPGDLVLAFRQAGSAADYVVNIGKAASFSELPAGGSVNISNLSVAQLNSAFPSLNGLRWSIAAANRPPVIPGFPLQTLWVTAPRENADAQSNPWLRKGTFTQGNPGSQIDGVGVNAALSSSLLPGGPDNTATGVVVPADAPFPIGPLLGADGDYAGAFQGAVENVTADDFDSDPANVSRSDLYELIPGTVAAGTLNTPGQYLGYFELTPNGTLSFHTGSTPPPAPSITSLERTNDLTTVSFTTVGTANYWLRASASLGLSVKDWPVVSGPIPGTGATVSLQDTNAANHRFFAVEAQP